MHHFNVGIIGPGRVAHRFAKAIHSLPAITLHSVFSRDITSANAFATQYENDSRIIASSDINAFLSDPQLHAVIVSTPDIHHTEYAMLAAKSNKHLLIEKPLCTDIEEATALVDLIDTSKVICSVGYHLRWHAGFRTLANYLHADLSNEIRHIDIRWGYEFIQEAKWRKSFSTTKWWSLTTLGTHLVDIVRWYCLPSCGEVIESIVTTTHAEFHTTDETSQITLHFENGATANIYSSILSHFPLDISITTSKEIITGNNLAGPYNERKIMISDKKLPFKCKEDLYEKELIDLHTSVNQGKQPEVTASEGLKNIACLIGF